MAASDKSVAVSFTTDFSSDSTVSDGWHELTKSDYAKVIFSDLLCNAASGTVECKFQITDNVHEDPNDFVGLFRIGYEDLSQCLVSKMLSQTKCEDDGKLQRCVFTANELPYLDDGFYQFLYVTRDQEVCGASMPFQIRMAPFQVKESSVESGSPEKMDAGFLLVKNYSEKKVRDLNEQQKVSVQRSALSEQKKEEIAAWVSQNPDYYSLIEQIREHTFTIDALQQSKDLAMKEVAQLYEILNKQNEELAQLRNMLAAYEEKTKMSQSLREEKTTELSELEKASTIYEEKLKIYEATLKEKDAELSHTKTEYCLSVNKNIHLQEKQQAEINILKKELQETKEMYESKRDEELTRLKNLVADYEEKLKKLEWLCEEKNKFISKIKQAYDASMQESSTREEEQLAEICDLKKELEKMKETENAKWRPGTSKKGLPMESLVQRAQDLLHCLTETLKNLDFTDEEELEKFFQLKIQMLIIESKMTRATDLANICDRNGLHKQIHSIMEKEAKRNSCDDPTPCTLENRGPLPPSSSTNVPEVENSELLIPSMETSELPDSSSTEASDEVAPKEDVSKIERTFKKVFESEVLDHQIAELPRLDVINKDIAMVLQADKTLDEDVAVMNRLTENIIKRGANLYEAVELGDDSSSSDSESDGSENSYCPTLKKNLICVGRIMDALSSSLSNQMGLEQLVVVENEEDKNLICRKKWDILLQKCALHYQIEILLEHIEKQKDGMKKVSEKFCELLTQYMLLKDEVRDSKLVIEKLEAVIDKKDMHIAQVEAALEFKNDLISHFCIEKEQLESRAASAERTNEDYLARIMDASDIYKKQYTKIGKLSRKLEKYKSLKIKSKSSKKESSMASESSKTTATSLFEVISTDSVRNINDSDTGEHMFEKASLVSSEKLQNPNSSSFCEVVYQSSLGSEDKKIDPKLLEVSENQTAAEVEAIEVPINLNKEVKAECENLTDVSENNCDDYISDSESCTYELESELPPSIPKAEKSIAIIELESEIATAISTKEKPFAATGESTSDQNTSVHLDFSTYMDFQEKLKQHYENLKKPPTPNKPRECPILCFFCKQMLPLDTIDPSHLMYHFEREHSMHTCPVCGQLFEAAIPQRYLQIHVNKHFERK